MSPSQIQPSASAPTAAGVESLLSSLHEINYYPARDAWTYMWTNWSAPAARADLARAAALGANAVRIFAFPSAFGYPTPSATMTGRLATFVSMAASAGLGIHLTLFDWWDGYSDIAGSERWAAAILSPLAGDTALEAVEIKNEIDPTSAAATTWARTLIPYVRTVDGGAPVAVSVPGSAGVPGLQQLRAQLATAQPDFYSLHYYANPAAARATIGQAQQAVAPVPLFVGEVGSSSLDPRGSVAGEAQQDLAFRTVAEATNALGLPAPAPWQLNDLTTGAVPPGAGAIDPSEYDMGLLRADGSAKPVAASVSQLFTNQTIDASFNNGFESGYSTPASATGSLPTDWSIFDPAQAQFARDTTVSHSGGASARIENAAASTTQVPAFYISPPRAFVIPGGHYTASVWARGQRATGYSGIAIAFFQANGAYLGDAQSAPIAPGTTGWTDLIASGVAPTGTAYVQVHLKSANNTGAVWFDDVNLSW
jgi:hypothetical protein